MKASSQEKANCSRYLHHPSSTATIPPTPIMIQGALRHFDKSSGATDEDWEFWGINYFLKSARFDPGTSSTVANWLLCSARI